MSDSIATRLSDIEARANAAAEGPWFVDALTDDGRSWVGAFREPLPNAKAVVVDGRSHGLFSILVAETHEARFCAAARTDVPWLVERVRTLLIRDEVLQGAYRTACCHREEAQKRVRELESLVRQQSDLLNKACPGDEWRQHLHDVEMLLLHGTPMPEEAPNA